MRVCYAWLLRLWKGFERDNLPFMSTMSYNNFLLTPQQECGSNNKTVQTCLLKNVIRLMLKKIEPKPHKSVVSLNSCQIKFSSWSIWPLTFEMRNHGIQLENNFTFFEDCKRRVFLMHIINITLSIVEFVFLLWLFKEKRIADIVYNSHF